MGASAIPIILMTLFWGLVGIVLPIILPKGPNRSCIVLAFLALLLYASDESPNWTSSPQHNTYIPTAPVNMLRNKTGCLKFDLRCLGCSSVAL
ncbi:hypothetical protein O3P69_013152 [Scylla paramamosain]|uniref:Uncharacterized protein n=1 Tax=Scylla paramamosain TaxID=85552 RepID=A0AAW0TYS3_SCYPA